VPVDSHLKAFRIIFQYNYVHARVKMSVRLPLVCNVAAKSAGCKTIYLESNQLPKR
jgi:hypothetical protein